MISKVWDYSKPKDELFKCFLRSTFCNSTTRLTDLEIDILDQVKKSRNGFNSNTISRNLDISVQSLNNYKSKLVKKQLLVKATDNKYYVNSLFNIPNTGNDEMVVTLKFKFND